MVHQEEVAESTRPLQWKCLESTVKSKCLYYGRFILSPLIKKDQANTIGIIMRKILLGEMEGTSIINAKFENVPHEYSVIPGIKESVHEILMNLKKIVLRSNLYEVQDAFICVKGPKCVTAQDIISPPSVEIIDTTQCIANLTEPVDLRIELQIKRDRGYRRIKSTNHSPDGSYPIDAVSMPVLDANYNIYSYYGYESENKKNRNENKKNISANKKNRSDSKKKNISYNKKKDCLFLEIWTNGSLTPKEALSEACRNLIDLFIPFLHVKEENTNLVKEENTNLDKNKKKLTFHEKFNEEQEILSKSIFIDQLELPYRIYYCLKRSNIHTLWDLSNKSEEDLMKMEYFRAEDVKRISDILKKRFRFYLPLFT